MLKYRLYLFFIYLFIFDKELRHYINSVIGPFIFVLGNEQRPSPGI